MGDKNAEMEEGVGRQGAMKIRRSRKKTENRAKSDEYEKSSIAKQKKKILETYQIPFE